MCFVIWYVAVIKVVSSPSHCAFSLIHPQCPLPLSSNVISILCCLKKHLCRSAHSVHSDRSPLNWWETVFIWLKQQYYSLLKCTTRVLANFRFSYFWNEARHSHFNSIECDLMSSAIFLKERSNSAGWTWCLSTCGTAWEKGITSLGC